jgi:integrase
MAKIIDKKPGNKYIIQYIPQGFKTIYKNPYRRITVIGKTKADRTVADLTAIEVIDKNERKLGRTDIVEIAKEISIGELFAFFEDQVMPWCDYAKKTEERYTHIMTKLVNDFGSEFLFKNITYKLILSNYATGKRNQCITMIKCINHIGAIGRQAIAGQLEIVLNGYKISSHPIKTPKIIKGNKNPLSIEQLEEIYANPDINDLTKDIMRLYIITGCRVSELTRPYFEWSQIDNLNGIAFIRNKGNKKEHSTMLEIPWLDQHQQLLERIAAYYKPWHQLANHYPIPITSQNVYDRIRTASKISGYHFTPHDLRDTGATLILRSTGNIYAAKEFCGHKSVRDTEESYADYNIYDKKNATNKLLNHLGSLL